MSRRGAAAWIVIAGLGLAGTWARAQEPAKAPAPPNGAPAAPVEAEDDLVQLDFNDVELAVVIDTIAKLTQKNFIYDDRVRGRVTILSPTKITVDQAYAVFESVLQVKGFTTVPGPGNAIKIIPVRDAKESSIDTLARPGPTPASDSFVTRLIPLRYIDAEAISNSLKPLVSKDAAMVAYPPTNTVILTDSGTNIRRILSILEAIDVESYKEELAVIKVKHADAATMAEQLGEIYGAEVAAAGDAATPLRAARARRAQIPGQPPTVTGEAPARDRVRLITDARTNSLIVLASRTRLDDIRRLVAKLDVPVTGGGRIHVYYLKNADAEELAETLNAMISGQPAPPSGGRGARGAGGGTAGLAAAQQQAQQALRAAVTELAEGITLTADKGTNSLVIQASQEGFRTLSQVIEQLDIRRPQVLVEALIMEVGVSNSEDLGFNGLGRIVRGSTDLTLSSLTDLGASGTGDLIGGGGAGAIGGLLANAIRDKLELDDDGNVVGGSLIQGLIRASASDGNTNILSAPHILTSDNEEAEIKIGNNIPIISSRVQSAQGITTSPDENSNLATSVNVERQDIGITLRVTPQISEGESLRLKIFQEITNVDETLSAQTGDPQQVGVALTNRKVENTVVVKDRETVVIGGLISDDYRDTVSKVPWLGDIPVLGWLFKTTGRSLTKTNLLVFLTPHIVRTPEDLESQTVRKREEFRQKSREAMEFSERELREEEKLREEAEAAGLPYQETYGRNPVRAAVGQHARRYPLERMSEIERLQAEERARQQAAEEAAKRAPQFMVVAAVYRNESAAAQQLTEIIDAGYDGTLVASERAGTILYEIHVGPYPNLDQAQRAADVLRQSYGLSPSVQAEKQSP